MLPGMDGTGRLFARLLPHLPPALEQVVVAYPGNEPLSYAQLLPFVQRALPGSEPFILLAESFSGPLAVMVASQHPQGLLGLVLVASFVRCPVSRVLALGAPLVRGWLMRALPPSFQAWALLGRRASAQHRLELESAVNTVSPAVLAARARQVLAIDVSRDLAEVSVPILQLVASEDALVLRSSAELIQRSSPHVHTVTIAAPHLLLQVAPREAATAIESFAHSLGAFER